MSDNLVVEVDGFVKHLVAEDFDELKAVGVVGVLVKLSQGLKWVNPEAASIATLATDAGLLVGALHRLETEHNPIATELAKFRSVLPGVYHALGLVVEVEPHAGADLYALGSELEAALKELSAAGHTVALRCSAEVLTTLSGAPWGFKWFAGTVNDLVQHDPFAQWLDSAWSRVASWVKGGYGLSSLRSLNPANGSSTPDRSLPEVAPPASLVPADPKEGQDGQNEGTNGSNAVDDTEGTHGAEPTPASTEPVVAAEAESDPDWRAKAKAATGL